MFVWSVPWGKFWRNHFLICSDLCIKTVCHVMTIFLLKVRVLSGESNYIGDKNYHKIRLVKLLDPVGFAGDKTSCFWKLNNSPCHRLRNLSASNIFHKKQSLNLPICNVTFVPKPLFAIHFSSGHQSNDNLDTVSRVPPPICYCQRKAFS